MYSNSFLLLNVFILFYVEIFRVAVLDLCAEAVSAPERFERGVYRRYQFLQPYFNGHQLPAGEASRKGIFLGIVISSQCFPTANWCQLFSFCLLTVIYITVLSISWQS